MHDRVELEVVATYIRERLLWILFKLDKKDLYNVQTQYSSIALRLSDCTKIASRSINCALTIDFKAFLKDGHYFFEWGVDNLKNKNARTAKTAGK